MDRERCVSAREPIGNLCVIRQESLQGWIVQTCAGLNGGREPLGCFATRGEAEAFAIAELAKLNAGAAERKYILRVDDCPCWQKEL